MVFYREGENQRPPLSLILPHLYLGAERDVTQDSLSSKGISYVLSVSRCSPQPAFLPVSRYLRIPIDDSLRDDLLPWIPTALRFIDGAVSSGSAVLVHCAAGISRSPALAVAYIMYSMGLDLDQAYRFVKERRPSISPNFNFLGQLQHFQGSLRQKSSDGRLIIRPLDSPDANLPHPLPSPAAHPDHQGKLPPTGSTSADEAPPRCPRLDEVQKDPSAAAACSLNRKLQTLNLTLNLTQRMPTHDELPSPGCPHPGPHPHPRHEVIAAAPGGEAPPAPLQPPTAGRASLLEKRRSLTLSLSPTVPTSTPSPHLLVLTPHHPATPQTQGDRTLAPVRDVAHVEPVALEARGQRQRGPSSSSCRKTPRESRGGAALPGGPAQGKSTVGVCSPPHRARNPLQRVDKRKDTRKGGEASRRPLHSIPTSPYLTLTTTTTVTPTTMTTTTIVDQQPSAETQKAACPPPRCVPEEHALEDQTSPLSPLSLTLSKVLGWGERVLLGVLLGPHVKLGQVALPYRC